MTADSANALGFELDSQDTSLPESGAANLDSASDASGLRDGFVFSCHGVVIGFRTNLPEIIGSVVERLPPSSRLDENVDAEAVFTLIAVQDNASKNVTYRLFYNDNRISSTSSIERLLALVEDLFRLEVSLWADDEYIFVHAGVVTHAGVAVVLPGRSGSGKTTLVSALLDAGARYCSDEMAVIDRSGLVHPFPTPLALRLAGFDTKRRIPVDKRDIETQPREIGLVMLLRYDPTLSKWRPRQLTAGQAMIAMLDHTVAARRLPKLAMRTFADVFQRARVFRGRRGDAETTATWIINWTEALSTASSDG